MSQLNSLQNVYFQISYFENQQNDVVLSLIYGTTLVIAPFCVLYRYSLKSLISVWVVVLYPTKW